VSLSGSAEIYGVYAAVRENDKTAGMAGTACLQRKNKFIGKNFHEMPPWENMCLIV
jgi:hypothetical protein